MILQSDHSPVDMICVWLEPAIVLNQLGGVGCVITHDRRLPTEGMEGTEIVTRMTREIVDCYSAAARRALSAISGVKYSGNMIAGFDESAG